MSTHHINGHTINTCYVFPPVPCRDYDWSAVTDEYDGAPDAGPQMVGYGRTEQAAIDALVDLLIERDLEAAPAKAIPPARCATNLDFVAPVSPVVPQDYPWTDTPLTKEKGA